MEKTYEKYMKQGSGTDYDAKNPDSKKKAPVPGWITYDMNEVDLSPSQKQLIKIARAEATVIGNQVKSLQQDISNGDIQGIRSSIGTIKFSVDRILKAVH